MANNNYGDGAFCSFCGKPREQADKLIAGMNDAYICDECVELCMQILDKPLPTTGSSQEIKLLKPKALKALLDEHVIGQDDAKIALAVAVYIITKE